MLNIDGVNRRLVILLCCRSETVMGLPTAGKMDRSSKDLINSSLPSACVLATLANAVSSGSLPVGPVLLLGSWLTRLSAAGGPESHGSWEGAARQWQGGMWVAGTYGGGGGGGGQRQLQLGEGKGGRGIL